MTKQAERKGRTLRRRQRREVLKDPDGRQYYRLLQGGTDGREVQGLRRREKEARAAAAAGQLSQSLKKPWDAVDFRDGVTQDMLRRAARKPFVKGHGQRKRSAQDVPDVSEQRIVPGSDRLINYMADMGEVCKQFERLREIEGMEGRVVDMANRGGELKIEARKGGLALAAESEQYDKTEELDGLGSEAQQQ